MATTKVKCPYCNEYKVSKNGKSSNGEQRYICINSFCHHKTFRLDYRYNGCKPGIDQTIISMTVNGSGIRDISRVEHVSTHKVMDTLKKLKIS